ncbi:hypothetical protein [Sutcliffiella halmapala]|uniref:hypothetical protein n=1 Tax=Sutcliffiella halmapala TaxID=79882 RepID=UPI000995451E|nr:hypothetical protein [Sutcliffiella halmapala]
MINFAFFSGVVTMISDFVMSPNGEAEGCYKQFSVENGAGSMVNFIVSPTTYFIDHARVSIGDRITGYHDANAPVPLIYPPRYNALIIVKENNSQNVKVDYFNEQLVSRDGQLKLNISLYTQILIANGQPFTGNLANRNLIVIYGPATKSIPAQTMPYKVIVWC